MMVNFLTIEVILVGNDIRCVAGWSGGGGEKVKNASGLDGLVNFKA